MSLFSKQPIKRKPKVNKCPHCGAVLIPTSTVCPDGNAEVSGISANYIVEDFTAQIKKADSLFNNTSVVSVIESFPIPAGRNDLLELLAFLAPKIKPTLVNDSKKDIKAIKEADAYFHKFEECVLKAKVYYAEDAAFEPYIKLHKSHKPTKFKNRKWFKKLIILIVLMLILVVLVVVGVGVFALGLI